MFKKNDFKMRYRGAIIVLLGVFTSLISCGQKKADKVCSIAFYNVENLFDTENDPQRDDDDFTPGGAYHYTRDIYEKKLQHIATVLDEMRTDEDPQGPALVGMAEVEGDRPLSDLVHTPVIAGRYQYICFKGPDPRGITTALMYDPKRFRIIRAMPVHINLPGGESTRDILFVRGKLNSDTVYILVNHWPSRREGEAETAVKRNAAAEANKHLINSILQVNPAAKIILMGDLNDDPDNESVARILDAKGEPEQMNATSLFNPWLNIYLSGSGTLKFSHHWDLFDQVMLSKAWLKDKGWHFAGAEIFYRDFLITQQGKFRGYPHRSFAGPRWINGYSDHLPVILHLQTNR